MAVSNDLKDCVGCLCADVPDKAGTKRKVFGTCFFVTSYDHHGNGTAYLVTAKHVWQDLSRYFPAYVRLNRATVAPGETGVIYFKLPDNWHFHKDSGVDIAVLPWTTTEKNVRLALLELSHILATSELLRPHGLPWPPGEGEEVVFVSMLVQYPGRERNFPASRFGHLAMIADETIKGKYGLSDYYLIDAQAYRGNSGSPVWVGFNWTEDVNKPYRGEKKVFLLGVLCGAFPEKAEMFQRERRDGETTVEEYHNLGICLVAPSEKLGEIINSPELKQMRAGERLNAEAEPIPLSSTE